MQSDGRGLASLLVTGASGLLGWQLCRQAVANWKVFGLYYRNRPSWPGITPVKCHLADSERLHQVFDQVAPRAVIHAAGVTKISDCRNEPRASHRINVEATALLAELCAASAIPMIFVSTDLVFDGKAPPYNEADAVKPLSIYGSQKVLAEKLVCEKWPGALVCRLPLLYGWAPGARRNFTLKVIARLAAGRPVSLFVDQYRTPVDTVSAAGALLRFLGNHSGLLHLGGPRRISRYKMGLLIADLMGRNPGILNPVQAAAIPGAEPLAPDVSLDSSLARCRGFEPFSLERGLRKTIRAAGFGVSC